MTADGRGAPGGQPPVGAEAFPPRVLRGLAWGALAGVAGGTLFGFSLVRGVIVIAGWERLYSIGPASMVIMWALLGAAVGVATVGVAVLLATPAPGGARSGGPLAHGGSEIEAPERAQPRDL